MRFRAAIALLGAVLLSQPACKSGKTTKAQAKRVAVLPFENQSGDARLDWAGRGIQIGVAAQLRNSSNVRVFESPTPAEAAAARADWLVTGYLAKDVRGATLHYVIEDLPRRKAVRSGQAGPVTEASLLERVNDVARSVGGDARQTPKSVEALKALSQGRFEEAVKADPGYGDAWLAWASDAVTRGNEAEALSVIARAREASPGKFTLARMKGLEGQVRRDRTLLRDAAVEAAEIAGDAESLTQAALAANATRDYARAEALFGRALEQEPDSENVLNSMAYAQAYQGKFDEALQTAGQYRKVSKDSPNSIDSEAEIRFMRGRFAEAAKVFEEAHKKASDFLQGSTLRKAAAAYANAGQLADAQRAALDYLKEREAAKDPLAEFNRALWEYRSARPGDAEARLVTLTRREPKGLAAIAAVQLALLRIEEGDFAGAQKEAIHARELGVTGRPAMLAALCLIIAEKDEPAAALAQTVAKVFPAQVLEPVRQSAVGLTLAYRKHFAEAIPFLKAAYERSDPGEELFARESYAWALVEAERFDEAKPLLASWCPPPSENVDLLSSLVETRALYLRARLAEKEGRAAEANRLFELFLKSHGPRGDRFGHVQKAKAMITL